MKPEATDQPAPIRAGSLPRAVWIGGTMLCLVIAALAGALVSKSIDSPRPTVAAPLAAPLAVAGGVSALSGVGTPVAALAQDEVPPPISSRPATPIATEPRAIAPVPTPAPAPAAKAKPARTAAPAVCENCGTVQSVRAVTVKGEGTGVGAVAGGVLGGVVGNQIGGGNGKTAMTVLGAIGGGFAGNEVERRTRSETHFDVQVRMRDGSYRVIRQSESMAVGTRVVVEGNRLRVT